MGHPTGTVTFLFTDIEGSTRLWEMRPQPMDRALQRHDALLRTAIESSGGYVFKTVGDAFCAAFSTTQAGVEAALAAQRALACAEWTEASIRVRMALHTGVCQERDGDYFGPAVNRTARLEAVAHGGQVVMSRATAELVRDLLPEGASLRDLGDHRLKDLSRPERVFQLDAGGLPVEFPPLRSLGAYRHNLPVPLTSFIGRSREVGELRALVDDSRLLTLAGAGGSGKTRLALQVAAEAVDRWENGVWFVDLAPLADPDLVAKGVAIAVGVREEPGRPLIDALIDGLHGRRLLVLLDNCEHLIDACAKLVDALLRSCPGVQVMATSREPLGLTGEHVYRVPSLSLPPTGGESVDRTAALGFEAVQLFLDRASSHNPAFVFDDDNVTLVLSVCDHLDGIPLAIELAAARLRSLSIGDIDGRLGTRFRLLTGGSRTALPRQQTLRALIDWSYELLHARDSEVLDRLSVFAGGFDLQAAEAVCASPAVESFEVVDAIGSLVDKSLLQADPTGQAVRYRLLETIRQYTAEKLSQDPEVESVVGDSHARYFLHLAEAAAVDIVGPDQARWLRRLETEHDNLRTAITHLLEAPGRTVDALRIGTALREFWYQRGHFSEALALFDDALDRPEAKTPSPLRVSALIAAAQMCLPRGESSPALTRIEEGLAIAQRIDAPALQAELLDMAAWIENFVHGESDTASSLIDEAVDLARRSGDRRVVARALGHRGGIRSDLDPSGARVDLEEALSRFRETGDQERVANTLNSLGYLELECGDLEAGRAHLEEAAALARDSSTFQLSTCLQNLGLAAIMLGDVESALRVRAECLKLCQDLGTLREIPYNLLGVALCLTATGAMKLAAQFHGAADALLEAMRQPFEVLEERLREVDQSHLRTGLGELAFESAYRAGRLFSSSQAMELAQRELRRASATASS
jgi:predicted ATPase/class 3 adenylate cyclase